MIKKVICQGQEVDAIVNGNGETLATLTAAVENEAAYIIPAGTLEVTKNGDYNVREKESIHVQVEGGADPVAPTLIVSEDGVVTASGAGVVQTTHQLSSTDDADFVASNIKNGVSIFGVTGSYEGGGSGFTGPVAWTTLVSSLESEKPLGEAWGEVPLPSLTFTGFLNFVIKSVNAPTQGSSTVYGGTIFIESGEAGNGYGILYYKSKELVASTVDFMEWSNPITAGNSISTMLFVQDGVTKWRTGSASWGQTRYVAAGASIQYAFVPISIKQMRMVAANE